MKLVDVEAGPVGPEYKYRTWIIPQVPGPAFAIQTETLNEARRLETAIAHFQLFLYDNKIMPDYANATSIEEWDGEDWMDAEE